MKPILFFICYFSGCWGLRCEWGLGWGGGTQGLPSHCNHHSSKGAFASPPSGPGVTAQQGRANWPWLGPTGGQLSVSTIIVRDLWDAGDKIVRVAAGISTPLEGCAWPNPAHPSHTCGASFSCTGVPRKTLWPYVAWWELNWLNWSRL